MSKLVIFKQHTKILETKEITYTEDDWYQLKKTIYEVANAPTLEMNHWAVQVWPIIMPITWRQVVNMLSTPGSLGPSIKVYSYGVDEQMTPCLDKSHYTIETLYNIIENDIKTKISRANGTLVGTKLLAAPEVVVDHLEEAEASEESAESLDYFLWSANSAINLFNYADEEEGEDEEVDEHDDNSINVNAASSSQQE